MDGEKGREASQEALLSATVFLPRFGFLKEGRAAPQLISETKHNTGFSQGSTGRPKGKEEVMAGVEKKKAPRPRERDMSTDSRGFQTPPFKPDPLLRLRGALAG